MLFSPPEAPTVPELLMAQHITQSDFGTINFLLVPDVDTPSNTSARQHKPEVGGHPSRHRLLGVLTQKGLF